MGDSALEAAQQLLHASTDEAGKLRAENAQLRDEYARLASHLAEQAQDARIHFRLDAGEGHRVSFSCRLDDLADEDVRKALVVARDYMAAQASKLKASGGHVH